MSLSSYFIKPNQETIFWHHLFSLLHEAQTSEDKNVRRACERMLTSMNQEASQPIDYSLFQPNDENNPLSSPFSQKINDLIKRSRNLPKLIRENEIQIICAIGLIFYEAYDKRLWEQSEKINELSEILPEQLKKDSAKTLGKYQLLDHQLATSTADLEYLANPHSKMTIHGLAHSFKSAFKITMEIKGLRNSATNGDSLLFTGYVIYALNKFKNLEVGFEDYPNGIFNAKLKDKVRRALERSKAKFQKSGVDYMNLEGALIKDIRYPIGVASEDILKLLVLLKTIN